MNRLHLNRLVSIGAVTDADNDPYPDDPNKNGIMLWKSKSGTPTPSGVSLTARGKGRDRAGRPVLSPADRSVLVAKVRLDVQDEAIAAMKKTTEESWDTLNEIRRMRGLSPMVKRDSARSSTEILVEVNRLANSIAKSAGEPMTNVEARVEVWRTHPELKTEIRKAQRLERKGGVVVDAPAKTVTDRIREVIDEATRKASWQPLMEGWGDGQTREQIISKVRVEVWRSPDGLELRDLERTHGSKPYTPAASGEIRKSRGGDRFARALNLLDSGIWSG